jgi:hypothetical protein
LFPVVVPDPSEDGYAQITPPVQVEPTSREYEPPLALRLSKHANAPVLSVLHAFKFSEHEFTMLIVVAA